MVGFAKPNDSESIFIALANEYSLLDAKLSSRDEGIQEKLAEELYNIDSVSQLT